KSALSSLLAVFFIQGCTSESFSPPMNGENIHFTATIPDELEALPISAMYRSKTCRKERRTANMQSYSVPGFHYATYPLSIGQSNQVEASVPKEGGGKCDWKLSNMTFEVKLKDTATIAPLIEKNFGFDATFVSDGNAPQVFDGGYLKISGDLHEKIILFPLLRKRFFSGNANSFYLIGKDDPLTYKTGMAKNINLTYTYINQMLSIWTDRKNNNRPFMTYPNGDIVYGEVSPEYEKLMRILE
ncbi:hypothetical protein, partial [Xenorhabdus szentirmaii]|uniref:hypothetical protein n=1 Tax=Xenorhabdus szentirmaii TaxID=290112 RepID=UPI0019BE7184